jgi:hypothetical protein
MASTPGDGSLAGLFRLAKSKIQTSLVPGSAKKSAPPCHAAPLPRNPDKLRHAPDTTPKPTS